MKKNRKAKIAMLRRAGWKLVPGSYEGQASDTLGRWYAHGPGMACMRKIGGGFATRTQAWDAVIRHVEALEEI